MNLSDALTVLGILAGPAIAFLSSWYFRRTDDRREMRKAAALLAQLLDEFAYNCAEVIGNNKEYRDSAGHAGEPTVCVPVLPDWPDSIDLRLIEPNALSKLLALRLKRELSNKRAIYQWEQDFPEEDRTTTETDLQCGVLGSEAMEIAASLRKNKEISLPDPEYGLSHWDVTKTLNDKRKAARSQLQKEQGII